MRIVPKIAAVSIIILVLIISLAGCSKEASKDVQVVEKKAEGKLVVTVMDKSEKKPLSDAKIVLMEGGTYITDDKGMSPEIVLEVNKDIYRKYGGDLWQKAPSGTVNIMISKDGYKDYVVFNKLVYPGYSSNMLNVEMEKLPKGGKPSYTVKIEQPHAMWIEELLAFCSEIEEESSGDGDGKATIVVKDQNSKAVEGASVVIPELGIKGLTDKNGNVVFNPNSDMEVFDIYPIKKDYMEYTVVAMKDGYIPDILFNASIYKEKDNNISMKINAAKEGQDGFTARYLPADEQWVLKIIDSYKNTGTE